MQGMGQLPRCPASQDLLAALRVLTPALTTLCFLNMLLSLPSHAVSRLSKGTEQESTVVENMELDNRLEIGPDTFQLCYFEQFT